MTSVIPIFLLIGGVSLGIGVALGVLFSMLRAQFAEPKNAESEEIKNGLARPVARLLRVERTGKIAVELDGRTYLAADALPGGAREMLTAAAADLAVWLGVAATAAKPTAEQPVPVLEAPVVVSPVVAPVVAADLVEPSKTSIVAQIDAILQDLLAASPLRDRSIFLREDPRRGVIVWVDDHSYDGIGAVKEPEVVAALQEAVSRWEKRK